MRYTDAFHATFVVLGMFCPQGIIFPPMKGF